MEHPGILIMTLPVSMALVMGCAWWIFRGQTPAALAMSRFWLSRPAQTRHTLPFLGDPLFMHAISPSNSPRLMPVLPFPRLSRNTAIAASVVALHVVLIWALQSGLVLRAAELIVPAEVLAQFIEPPAPQVTPAPPALPALPTPVRAITPAAVTAKKTIVQPPAQSQAQRLAIADPISPIPPIPSPNAQTGNMPPADTAAVAPVMPTAPPAPPSTPIAAALQLPSSDANYLQNPKPAYPPLSKRLGEQGKVTVRVLIAADGVPQKTELRQSSGFERLDQAALVTVMKWRYVPGKRNGVAEDMWFNVPINFVLE